MSILSFKNDKTFKFSNISKCENTIRSTWKDLKVDLANKKFLYNDISAALTTDFLKTFNDIFLRCKNLLEKRAKEILSYDFNIVRAAHIKNCKGLLNYERFIPNKDYMTFSNRFSPKGVEWLYLAIGPRDKNGRGFSIAEKCSLKERCASVGKQYALCHFKL